MQLSRSLCIKILILICLPLPGCSSIQEELPTYGQLGAVCDGLHKCYYNGEIKVWESHPPMAVLTMQNGECINVSLSDKALKKLRIEGPKSVKISATKMQTPPMELDTGEIIRSVRIRGREIPPTQCNSFYLFVK